MNEAYIRTVQLLLDIAPAVFETPVFAMKGGTAINLFVQDMPRLSVDIDVVFVPHDLKPRVFGGSCEIRTHGGFDPSPVFKTGALNRSAKLPIGQF